MNNGHAVSELRGRLVPRRHLEEPTIEPLVAVHLGYQQVQGADWSRGGPQAAIRYGGQHARP